MLASQAVGSRDVVPFIACVNLARSRGPESVCSFLKLMPGFLFIVDYGNSNNLLEVCAHTRITLECRGAFLGYLPRCIGSSFWTSHSSLVERNSPSSLGLFGIYSVFLPFPQRPVAMRMTIPNIGRGGRRDLIFQPSSGMQRRIRGSWDGSGNMR